MQLLLYCNYYLVISILLLHFSMLFRHVKFLKKKKRDNARNDLFFTSNFAHAPFAKICIKQDWNLFKVMFRILKEAITFVVL